MHNICIENGVLRICKGGGAHVASTFKDIGLVFTFICAWNCSNIDFLLCFYVFWRLSLVDSLGNKLSVRAWQR